MFIPPVTGDELFGTIGLALDSTGRVIASGSVSDPTECENGFVVELDPADGRAVWSRTFDGTFQAKDCTPCHDCHGCPAIDNDELTAMAVDPKGRVLVSLGLIDGHGVHAHLHASVRRLALHTDR